MTNVYLDRSFQTSPWDFDDDGGAPPPPPTPPTPTLSDSALRAQAGARYDAAVADPALLHYCKGRDANYDRCVVDTIPDGVTFKQHPGDADVVDAKDVHQGRLGDCALMASLCALATTPQGRALIRNSIVENKDASGAVTSYSVTLHKPEEHILGLGTTTYPAVQVQVKAPFVLGHAWGPDHEIWPAILEKAYAQVSGGYNAIGHGGPVKDVVPILTGQPAEQLVPGDGWLSRLLGTTISVDRLQAALATGKCVVLSTPWETKWADGNHGLDAPHAYVLTGIEERDGQTFMTLKNPWGSDHPAPVPFAELAKWFSCVDIMTVPGSP